MIYSFDCPTCDAPLEADVDLGEHMVDMPETCDCGHMFSDAEKDALHAQALEDCQGQAIDRAYEAHKDRQLGL
jgi:hypothetical protein